MKSRKFQWMSFSLISCLWLASMIGCTSQPVPAGKTDAQIATDVQNKIMADGNVTSKQVSVSSSTGTVTLAGTVHSEFERTAAANDASQVDGVKAVVNNLGIDQAMAAVAAAPLVAQAPARAPKPVVIYRNAPARREAPRTERNSPPPPQTASNTPQNNAPAPPPEPTSATIREGTQLAIRTLENLDSDTSQPGDVFHGTLDGPISADGHTIGGGRSAVEGRVVSVKPSTHFSGRSELALQLTRLTIGNKSYPIETDTWSREGNARGKNTVAKGAGGAALGALIGGLAGGGRGAAIGAGAGAAAGTGVNAVTKGQRINLRPETSLTFRLQSPVTVALSGRESDRQRLPQ